MKKQIVYVLSFLTLMAVSCDDDDKKTDPSEEKKAQFSGKDILGDGDVLLERNKSTKEAVLKVNLTGDWELYAGPTAEEINFDEPVLAGSGNTEKTINISNSARSIFQFNAGNDQAILAERHLPMSGRYNFRDLGGFKTVDGKFVKWGKLFRSDELSEDLTSEDNTYLSSIPLISIVDFRSQEEKDETPDVPPATVKNYYELPLDPGNLAAMSTSQLLGSTEEALGEIMKEMNREFVTDSICIVTYKKFFEFLQDESNLPLIFHCSAGKDRTGMGSFLFLSSLGVPEDVIIDDYLFSNDCLRDKYESQYGKEAFIMFPQLNVITGVKAEFLQTAIDQLKKDHGSVENYLRNTLNVDLDKMKAIYLY